MSEKACPKTSNRGWGVEKLYYHRETGWNLALNVSYFDVIVNLGQTCSVCVSVGTNQRTANLTYCNKEVHSGYCEFNMNTNKPECHCPDGYKPMPNKMGCMVRVQYEYLVYL